MSETTWSEDQAIARAARDLDSRLITARTRFHAGDLARARADVDAAIAGARGLQLRPLLAEALLLLGEIHEVDNDAPRGREAVVEAAVHAMATRRDDLTAEALARRIYFDAMANEPAPALADEALVRAAAERLADPTTALARLDHNLGVLHLMQRDRDAARPYLERATAALEHARDGDPIERANYWINLAIATRDPLARERAATRAVAMLAEQLGEHHRRVLLLKLLRGLHGDDAASAAAELDAVCPQYSQHYPDAVESCVHCFHNLGLLHHALGRSERASDASTRVRSCAAGALDQGRADQLASFRDRAGARDSLLRGRPDAALSHADAALARNRPYRDRWWIAADDAALELSRAHALHALGRDDEARAGLARALAVLEDMSEKRGNVIDELLLGEARALLTRLPPTAPPP